VALGDVITQSSEPPVQLPYRVVHKALLRPANLGARLWCDEGGFFSGAEDVSVWQAPLPAQTMYLSDQMKQPPPIRHRGGTTAAAGGGGGEWWQLAPAFTPIEARQFAVCIRSFEPDADDFAAARGGGGSSQLSLRKDELLTVLESDPDSGWWLCAWPALCSRVLCARMLLLEY
jgi:hypothetical protein